jgi:hypothetical protein
MTKVWYSFWSVQTNDFAFCASCEPLAHCGGHLCCLPCHSCCLPDLLQSTGRFPRLTMGGFGGIVSISMFLLILLR